MDKDNSTLKSKIGIIGVVIAVLIGLWFLGTALSGGSETPDCPAGQVWSEAHQHCH